MQLLLAHADRENDALQPGELEPALDRVRGLVVQEPVDEPVPLENELPEIEDRPRKFPLDLEREVLRLVDRLRPERIAEIGFHSELVRELDVLAQVRLGRSLERRDLGFALETGRVDHADGNEQVVLVVTGKQRLDREERDARRGR